LVVGWQSHNLLPEAANDVSQMDYARRFAAFAREPQFRLAAALACIALGVAAFDLLKNTSGL
jgi:hypothetical protein